MEITENEFKQYESLKEGLRLMIYKRIDHWAVRQYGLIAHGPTQEEAVAKLKEMFVFFVDCQLDLAEVIDET